MKKIINSLILIVILSIVALADIPPPKTPVTTAKEKQVELFIVTSAEVTEPTLVIKKSSTKLLRAALDEAEGIENNLVQTESTQPNFTASTQTIVGGMFLTFAFVFGGVWLVRSKKPSKTVIGLFLVGVFAAGSVLVFANIAPPRRFGITKNMLSEEFQSRSGASARGKVRVKIVNGTTADSDIKLLVPMNSENTEE
jgi:hypothetical protein